MENSHLRTILIFLLCCLILAGFLVSGIAPSIEGFWKIQLSPARLISDYVELAGVGGTLLNAAIVGLLGVLLISLTKIIFSGPTFAAVLTMTGFGFFGKTPLNILPIIFGVYLAALLVRKTMRDYLIIALFGTALGPLINMLAWELGFVPALAIPISIAGGIAAGFFLPPIAVSMLHLHQGYNLYNMGLSCGFFSLFAAALVRGFGGDIRGILVWHANPSLFLKLLVPAISLALIVLALIFEGKQALHYFIEIQKLPGRLPSDFADMTSISGALLNSGLLGLVSSAYIFIIQAQFNGPVIGGLFTLMGFGLFGSTLRNSWPVMAGVIAATLLTGNSLSAPGPVLAFIFGTTLGPLAGEFGIPVGFAAGFVHFLMVMQTGAWSGGINLYNNGFAGGLTATLFVSVIQWIKSNRASK